MSTLDQNISKAVEQDRLYVPTFEEYRNATVFQRRRMTWPREVLEQIARERP